MPHHTAHTPTTLLQTASAAFSFHLSNSYSSLPLWVPPSLTLVLSFHPPLHLTALLYPSFYFVFMSISMALFSSKRTLLHIAYCGCRTCISTLHSGCINVSQDFGCIQRITARSEVSGRDVQFKRDQSTKGVCHICPLCRAALTASDDSFHQWHWSVWQAKKRVRKCFLNSRANNSVSEWHNLSVQCLCA